MLISAVVASVMLFAAPAGAPSGAEATPAAQPAAEAAKPAAAEAKPEMRRVCELVEVPNSRAPQKKCRMTPARGAPAAE